MISYMFWYTFKDDIMGFSLTLFKTIFKTGKETQVDNVDKSFFGIITYFVQAAAMIRLTIENSSSSITVEDVQEIEKCMGLMLSIELS